MPSRTKEANREYQRKWWQANKKTQILRVKQNAKKFKEWAQSLKDFPCTDCGVKYHPQVMDWDHIGEKTANVSNLVRRSSKRRLLDEVANCELVCANCHRMRTYKRANGLM